MCSHAIDIFKADGTGMLANTLMTDGAPRDKYAWTRVIERGWLRNLLIPLKLEASTSYCIMSHEDGADGDACYAQATGKAAPGITINCSVTSPESPCKPIKGAGTAIGPVNFTFTDTPQGDMGFTCDAADGVQFAFIGDTGTMTQTVDFPKAGTFSVSFNAAIKPDAANPIDIYVNGVKYTSPSGITWQPSAQPWVPGGFERRADDLALAWGSAPFSINRAGKHEIQIRGTGKAGQYMFLDDMKFLSVNSIYGPDCCHFPSMGEANGQDPRGGLDTYISTLHNEINWTAAWGLKTMAYEGGWSLGGDFDQKPIHSYCKFVSPRTLEADAKAVDVYTSGGGTLFCYFYPQWRTDDIHHALQYPLVQAVIKRNDLLPTEVDYGNLVPANISPDACSVVADNADRMGNLPVQGAWINWNIIAPATHAYRLTSTVAGHGGSCVLLTDDAVTVACEARTRTSPEL